MAVCKHVKLLINEDNFKLNDVSNSFVCCRYMYMKPWRRPNDYLVYWQKYHVYNMGISHLFSFSFTPGIKRRMIVVVSGDPDINERLEISISAPGFVW